MVGQPKLIQCSGKIDLTSQTTVILYAYLQRINLTQTCEWTQLKTGHTMTRLALKARWSAVGTLNAEYSVAATQQQLKKEDVIITGNQ